MTEQTFYFWLGRDAERFQRVAMVAGESVSFRDLYQQRWPAVDPAAPGRDRSVDYIHRTRQHRLEYEERGWQLK